MTSFSKKKYFRLAKGFFGKAKNCIRIAVKRVQKSLQYSYISRRLKKRQYRRDWIQTINGGLTVHNINYNQFIYGLNKSNLVVNRKILADLAKNQPYTFKAIVDQVEVQGQVLPRVRYELREGYQKGLIGNEIGKQNYEKEQLPIKIFGQDQTI